LRTALLKNFSFLTISNLLMPIASMALVVAISRFGGVEMLGEYSFLLTFFFIGQTCATAGLHIIVTRDVARERAAAGAYFASACWIGMAAAAVLSLILLPIFMWSVPSTATRIGLLLTAAALFPTVVITFGESVLLAFERAFDFVVIELIEVAVRATIAAAMVVAGFGIVAVSATILACRIATAVGITLAVRRYAVPMTFGINRERLGELAAQVPIVGAIPIVNALYWRADTLLLTWLRGLADVGFYGAATRILDVTRSFPQAYARALYPQLARLHQEDREEFRLLCRQSLTWVVAGTIPLALIISGLADIIITSLYGSAVAPAGQALAVMAWVMIPYTLTNTLAQILFASGNQAFDLKVNLIATLTSVIFNVALIPYFGFVGAAVASLGTMILHVSLQYRFVRRHVHDPGMAPTFIRLGIGACAGAAALLILRPWSPTIAAAVALATYGVALGMTGILTRAHVLRISGEVARRVRRAPALSPTTPIRKEPA